VGLYPKDDGYQTLERIVQLRERLDPQPESREGYDRSYRAFCALARQSAGLGAGFIQ
jgi:hypothetical protein